MLFFKNTEIKLANKNYTTYTFFEVSPTYWARVSAYLWYPYSVSSAF